MRCGGAKYFGEAGMGNLRAAPGKVEKVYHRRVVLPNDVAGIARNTKRVTTAVSSRMGVLSVVLFGSANQSVSCWPGHVRSKK